MVAVALVLVVLLVGGTALAAAIGVDRRVAMLVGGGVVVALVVLSVLGLAVGRGGEDEGDGRVARSSDDAPAVSDAPVLRPVDVLLPVFDDDGAFAPVAPVLDELPERATRFVGLASPDPLLLQQCVLDAGDQVAGCGRATPAGYWVDFHAGLVELERNFVTTGGRTVDCQVDRCVLVARNEDGSASTTVGAQLVFGLAAGRPTLEVDGRERRPGDRVQATVRGLQPDEDVAFTWCAPPGPFDPKACDRPTASSTTTTDRNGTASVELVVPDAAGERQASCSPRGACAIAVRGASLAVAPGPITFAGAEGPDLPTGRVLGGLAGAALAAALAVWLLRRRETIESDPFAGISLAVPEWEHIDLSVVSAAEAALEATPGIRGS
jgi:hypothetical protein